MPINPAEISTVRVGELPLGSITLDSLIPIENDAVLEHITVQDLVDFLNINIGARQYQFIELYVDQAYIDTNFDNTGLGIGICEGIAICNGQNGTPLDDGLVHIAYGTNYSVINAVGGSKDAVVVAHTHTFVGSEGNTPVPGSLICTNDTQSTGTQSSLSTTGVSGTNKNMQPYRVVLRCMKL